MGDWDTPCKSVRPQASCSKQYAEHASQLTCCVVTTADPLVLGPVLGAALPEAGFTWGGAGVGSVAGLALSFERRVNCSVMSSSGGRSSSSPAISSLGFVCKSLGNAQADVD